MQDADAYHSFVTSFWQPSPPREPLTRPKSGFSQRWRVGSPTAGILAARRSGGCLDWQLVMERDNGYAFTCDCFAAWTQRASGGVNHA